jgi:CubicO group peptidase (beta-lactamase class C family)
MSPVWQRYRGGVPTADLPRIHDVFEHLYADDAAHGLSLATVVVHGGEVIAERYGHQPDTVFGPGGAVTADTTLISWSMAKSITHALVGVLVGDDLIDLDEPVAMAGWHDGGKATITVQHLLDMKPGLLFVEDYVDDQASHCIEMLYGSGADDMAAYAAALPLLHPPGTTWNYASGTTNIICRVVADLLAPGSADGGRAAVEAVLRDRLFEPAGMASAIPKFDTAGTFIGSSYVYATARDFARFGELYRNDGVTAAGRRILPEGWRDHAAKVVAHDEAFDYGRHWWVWRDHPGSFACHGYEGQFTIVVPSRRLVLVHLGKSPVERREALHAMLGEIIDAVAAAG